MSRDRKIRGGEQRGDFDGQREGRVTRLLFPAVLLGHGSVTREVTRGATNHRPGIEVGAIARAPQRVGKEDRKARLVELENSSRRTSEFLAMLSHELRNPLAPMRNAVSIMQIEPLQSPRLRNCRDIIDRQVLFNGAPGTIIGVAQPAFTAPAGVPVWELPPVFLGAG